MFQRKYTSSSFEVGHISKSSEPSYTQKNTGIYFGQIYLLYVRKIDRNIFRELIVEIEGYGVVDWGNKKEHMWQATYVLFII